MPPLWHSIRHQHFKGLLLVSPRNDAGPVTLNRPPILIVPDAKAIVALQSSIAATPQTITNFFMLSSCFNLHRIESLTCKNTKIIGSQCGNRLISLIKTEDDHRITATAFHKGIYYSTLVLSHQGLQNSGQTTGLIRHLNRHHFGFGDGKPFFFQHCLAFSTSSQSDAESEIIGNQPETGHEC